MIGLPAPTSVNGVAQMPLSGVSMAYTFDDAKAPTKKPSQYYEMLGSRAIWANGWTAVTWHEKGKAWEDDKWELYNTDEDFSQAHDLADKIPEKLKELQALWFEEAKKNNVLPLDDRRYERVADPSRPVAALPRSHYVFYPGTSILHPLAAPQILGVDHKITANVELANRLRKACSPAAAASSADGASISRTASSSTPIITSRRMNIRSPRPSRSLPESIS